MLVRAQDMYVPVDPSGQTSMISTIWITSTPIQASHWLPLGIAGIPVILPDPRNDVLLPGFISAMPVDRVDDELEAIGLGGPYPGTSEGLDIETYPVVIFMVEALVVTV